MSPPKTSARDATAAGNCQCRTSRTTRRACRRTMHRRNASRRTALPSPRQPGLRCSQEAQASRARDAEPRRGLRRAAPGGTVGCGEGGGSARGVELHRGFLSCRPEAGPPRAAESSSNCSDFVTPRGGSGTRKPSLTGFSGTSQPTRGNSRRHAGEIWLSRERKVSDASLGPVRWPLDRAPRAQSVGRPHLEQHYPHAALPGRGHVLGTLVLSWRGRFWGDRLAFAGYAATTRHRAYAPPPPQPGPCQ